MNRAMNRAARKNRKVRPVTAPSLAAAPPPPKRLMEMNEDELMTARAELRGQLGDLSVQREDLSAALQQANTRWAATRRGLEAIDQRMLELARAASAKHEAEKPAGQPA